VANEKHLLLTFSGDYDYSDLQTESWQTGIRLKLALNEPFGDDVGTLPNNWEPSPTTINRTETHWTIQGNWEINLAPSHFSPDDYLNDIVAPAWTAFLGGTPCSSHLKTRQIKLSPIVAPLGHLSPAPPYLSGTPCVLDYTSAYPEGGSGSNLIPLQNSFAVSLRSPQPGRRGRGRMFMPPMTTAALGTHGFMDSTQQTNTINSAKAFLEALAWDSTVVGSQHIRPVVTGKPYSSYGVVTQTRLDNIVDTQRRRRRSLVGTILTATPSY